jgi:DNA-binding MarR family transcriptional regulator
VLTIVVISSIILSVSPNLQKELKQKKPFASREEEAYLSILRSAEALSWAVTELLKGADLTPTQYNALRILRGAGEEGASCSEVGERMVTKDSDITRLLDRLERRGLITRERGIEDRRRITTRITDDGLSLLAELDEPVIELQRRQLGHLGAKRLSALIELLNATREKVG